MKTDDFQTEDFVPIIVGIHLFDDMMACAPVKNMQKQKNFLFAVLFGGIRLQMPNFKIDVQVVRF